MNDRITNELQNPDDRVLDTRLRAVLHADPAVRLSSSVADRLVALHARPLSASRSWWREAFRRSPAAAAALLLLFAGLALAAVVTTVVLLSRPSSESDAAAEPGLTASGPVAAGVEARAGLASGDFSVPPAFVAGYAKQISFVASGYAGATGLTNFPVLVRLSAGLAGFSYSDFRLPDGGDLRFADVSGQELPFDIDTWDTNGVSCVWVRVPVLTATTRFVGYFGNPSPAAAPAATNVWSAYAGVWHLGDADGTGVSRDSGPFGIDGTNDAATVRRPDGTVGACRRISDGATRSFGGGIIVPGYTNLPITSVFTIGGWLRHKNQQSFWDHVFFKKNGVKGTSGFSAECYGENWAVSVYGSADDGNDPASLVRLPGGYVDRRWTHFELVYDGTNVAAYVDGVRTLAAVRAAVTANNCPLAFGTTSTNGEACWKGEMDEIRVAPVAFSSDWVAAEAATVSDPAFLVAGPVLPTDPDAPALFVSATNVLSETAEVRATLVADRTAVATVTCAYGTAPNALAEVESWTGTATNGGVYAHALTGLAKNTTYYAVFSASCAAGGVTRTSAVTNTFVTGGTTTWTGKSGTTDWFTAGNWEGGVVPPATADVQIPAGATIDVAGRATAASLTFIGSGWTTLVFADGASLAVGGDLVVTGTVDCAFSGGTVAVGGNLVCGCASGGSTMTVDGTAVSAGDLVVGYREGGSRNVFTITNGASVALAGRAVVGLGCSTAAPASSNLLLVAKGGVLVAPDIYVSLDTNETARAQDNRLIVDGGAVTNTVRTFLAKVQVANSQSHLSGFLVVRNGGLFENDFSETAIIVRPTASRDGGKYAEGGISVLDGGELRLGAGGRISYPQKFSWQTAVPFLAITNGTVVCGGLGMDQGCGLFVAGAAARLEVAGSFRLASQNRLEFGVPARGWTDAPVQAGSVDADPLMNLVVDATAYAGKSVTNMPLVRATGAGHTVPANYATGNPLVFRMPGPKWEGELEFSPAHDVLGLTLTAPKIGFVIRICDNVPTVPYSWIQGGALVSARSSGESVTDTLWRPVACYRRKVTSHV